MLEVQLDRNKRSLSIYILQLNNIGSLSGSDLQIYIYIYIQLKCANLLYRLFDLSAALVDVFPVGVYSTDVQIHSINLQIYSRALRYNSTDLQFVFQLYNYSTDLQHILTYSQFNFTVQIYSFTEFIFYSFTEQFYSTKLFI